MKQIHTQKLVRSILLICSIPFIPYAMAADNPATQSHLTANNSPKITLPDDSHFTDSLVIKKKSLFRRLTYNAGFYLKLLANDAQIMKAMWSLSKINQPMVTIFGGGRINQQSKLGEQAYSLAKKLADANVAIMTGAHGGIMEAANCGAKDSGKPNMSIGVSVKGIKQDPNKCLQKYLALTHFPSRKFVLIHLSSAFVVFPGGYGTFDELTEILNLMGTKKMPARPIILIDTAFWHKFIAWLHEEVFTGGHVSQEKLSLIQVTDDIDQAFNWIIESLHKKS